MEKSWTVETLKEYFEKILEEKEKANNQRFQSQEEAIRTAEHSRDVAIKKAEDSIEKKSDAVYVKLTDLQKALTEVMLRPEIEARFIALTEKVDDIKTSRDRGEGRSTINTENKQQNNWLIGIAIAVIISAVEIGLHLLR